MLQLNDDRSANPSLYGDHNYSQGINSMPQTPMYHRYSTPFSQDSNTMSADRNLRNNFQQTQAFNQNQMPRYHQPQLSSFAQVKNQQMIDPAQANAMNPVMMPDHTNMYFLSFRLCCILNIGTKFNQSIMIIQI